MTSRGRVMMDEPLTQQPVPRWEELTARDRENIEALSSLHDWLFNPESPITNIIPTLKAFGIVY